MKISKKNLLVSAASVVTAATLLLGGATYAYLQDETEDKVNTFNPNKVLVDLTETGEGKYDIIPGKTDTKDPKVIVDNTVDAYVYVEVTDNTDGLVTWKPTSDWTLLEGTDNVYYREVAAKATPDAAPQEIYFLEGNQVSYDKAITNDKMINADGSLKEGFTLEFRAFAIQKDPFNDPVKAYYQSEANDEASFKEAVNKGGNIMLTDNVAIAPDTTITDTGLLPQIAVTKDITLDLSGKTLGVDPAVTETSLAYTPAMFSVAEGATLTIDGNGTINAEAGNNNSYGIDVQGGTVVVNSGNVYGAPSAIQVETGSLVINGGFFDLAPTVKGIVPGYAKYVINCIDSNFKNGTATIEIKGGTFVNFDPSANPEGANTTYVADGYKVVAEAQTNGETWYTVVPEATA